MANEFNHNLDKITERELVPDIISRLTLGNPFKVNVTPHSKIDVAEIGDNFQQFLESLTSIAINDYNLMLNIPKMKKWVCPVLSEKKEIVFYLAKSCNVVAIIPESLKYNIVNLFTCDNTTDEDRNIYKLTLDTNYGINDSLNIYYYEN